MSNPKPSTLPVYRVNLRRPFPQKSMVQIMDYESMRSVRDYPKEHFFDLDDAWKALEALFRKHLQDQQTRYYDTKAAASRIEGELQVLERDLAAISRREGGK